MNSRSQVRQLFVVGIGRSGTSLLQSMLAANERIAMLPESGFFRRYVLKGKLHRATVDEGPATAVGLVQQDEYATRLDVDFPGLVDTAVAGEELIDLSVYLGIIEHYSSGKGARIAGDKDPRCIENIRRLVALLPGVKIVHITRDPRDVLASRKRAAWSKGRSTLRHLVATQVQWRLWRMASANEDIVASCRLVRYEDLVGDPAPVLDGVCQWLGIPYSENMLKFQGEARRLVSDSEEQWKGETLGPLRNDRVGTWKHGLSNLEIMLCEAMNKDLISECGYSFSDRQSRGGLMMQGCVSLLAFMGGLVCSLYVGIHSRMEQREIGKSH